jgi:type IV pili sensor histidine kinase/response regulator
MRCTVMNSSMTPVQAGQPAATPCAAAPSRFRFWPAISVLALACTSPWQDALAETLSIEALSSEALSVETLRVAHYSTVDPTPSAVQRDLLLTPVSDALPPEIQNVGDAVRSLLVPAGYRLFTDGHFSSSAQALLQLPLPAAHRDPRPLPLREALRLLIGPGFVLLEDPMHRAMAVAPCHDNRGGQ